MQKRQVLFGVLGAVLVASAVRADVPATVKILNQDYTVTATPRTGTFKNGVTVNPQQGDDANPVVPLKANLAFTPGGPTDGSGDRLFLVAGHQDNLGPTSDGFYMLQGADANGIFSPTVSNATVFFRGDREVHGRPQNVLFLNDTDTGAGADRNLVVYTFTTANMLRWYDLSDLQAATRTNQNAFRELSVFRMIRPYITEPVEPPDPAREDLPDDDNMPAGDYLPTALTPNGTLLTIGREAGDWAIGAMDPLKGTSFYPVKTFFLETEVGDQIDTAGGFPHTFVRLRGDEYLILSSMGDPNWDDSGQINTTLYHVRIQLPADLTQEAPNAIQVELLGQTDLTETGLGQSESGSIFGLAVGREVSEGNPTLYMADWAGNLLTLRPSATAGQ